MRRGSGPSPRCPAGLRVAGPQAEAMPADPWPGQAGSRASQVPSWAASMLLLLPSQHNPAPREGSELSCPRVATQQPSQWMCSHRGVPLHPGHCQQGMGPASHRAWLGAGPGAGSDLLVSH